MLVDGVRGLLVREFGWCGFGGKGGAGRRTPYGSCLHDKFPEALLTAMTTGEIEELFARVLTGDYEDESSWEAVRALQLVGTREVFEKAAELCRSKNSLSRAGSLSPLASGRFSRLCLARSKRATLT